MQIGDFLSNLGTTTGLYELLKVLITFLSLVYVLLAFILTRTVAIMNKSFQTKIGPYFQLFSWIHFIASVVVFFLLLLSI